MSTSKWYNAPLFERARQPFSRWTANTTCNHNAKRNEDTPSWYWLGSSDGFQESAIPLLYSQRSCASVTPHLTTIAKEYNLQLLLEICPSSALACVCKVARLHLIFTWGSAFSTSKCVNTSLNYIATVFASCWLVRSTSISSTDARVAANFSMSCMLVDIFEPQQRSAKESPALTRTSKPKIDTFCMINNLPSKLDHTSFLASGDILQISVIFSIGNNG